MQELLDWGFLKIVIKGSFSLKTPHASTFILTCHPYKGSAPTKEFAKHGFQEIKKKNQRYQDLNDTVSNNDLMYGYEMGTVSKSDTVPPNT